MSDADWDAEDFEPQLRTKKAICDKWDGEDEDDDIKDSWDKESDEDEVKSEKTAQESAAYQAKKKKKISDIIAEREASKSYQMEEMAQLEKEKAYAETPEGKAEEKLRLLQLEERVNLDLAKDMMGVSLNLNIDGMNPSTKDDFAQFEKALIEKISTFSAAPYYTDFIENFLRNLCADLSSTNLKKIKLSFDALHSAKLKEEKAAKNKKKPTVKMDLRKDYYVDDGSYDMDDFM
uniref:Eukaryotic translation initiation factor 3 subunit J-A n=2 Tax=Lepeophtheirus salmonis TaxID=72036 RepID=D3PIU1_LEPSM|nr:Eukaryotic translation initiation factor 3 subunit J-A [Lepeophtheirus salmonis]